MKMISRENLSKRKKERRNMKSLLSLLCSPHIPIITLVNLLSANIHPLITSGILLILCTILLIMVVSITHMEGTNLNANCPDS